MVGFRYLESNQFKNNYNEVFEVYKLESLRQIKNNGEMITAKNYVGKTLKTSGDKSHKTIIPRLNIQNSTAFYEATSDEVDHAVVHPENDTIRNVSHILWSGKPTNSTSTAKNAVFYGDQAIDRSPSIQGWAKVYAYNMIIIDEDDLYAFGFQVI